MTKPPHVVYWNNQPTPYVVDRLNAVVDRGINLEAWFDNRRESDRSWTVDPSSWRFESRVLGTSDQDRLRSRVPFRLVQSVRPDLLICNYDRAHMVVGALTAAPYCGRIALRALPSFDAWGGNGAAQEAAKHLIFRAVDGAKVPGPDGRAYAERYGMPADRIWTVKQSIMDADYASALALTSPERAVRRHALGLDARCTFVYVGRIWKGKGLDTLIDAFAIASESVKAQLLIVGDGEDKEHFRNRTEAMDGVVWAGFVQPGLLPMIYAACDVLVFPTLGDPNGLVVEEAMASGIPVISSDAAGDIRTRVPDGEAGYVVPAADARVLAERMVTLAQSPATRQQMGSRAQKIAADFSSQRYAQDFESFVQVILKMPPRHLAIHQMIKTFQRVGGTTKNKLPFSRQA